MCIGDVYEYLIGQLPLIGWKATGGQSFDLQSASLLNPYG